MGRRYTRDKKGRFASTGASGSGSIVNASGPGSISRKPVVFSAAAADTRTAGMIQRGNRRATVRATRATAKDSPARAATRLARTQGNDIAGIRSDLRASRREALDFVKDAIGDQGAAHPVARATSKYRQGKLSQGAVRRRLNRAILQERSTDSF